MNSDILYSSLIIIDKLVDYKKKYNNLLNTHNDFKNNLFYNLFKCCFDDIFYNYNNFYNIFVLLDVNKQQLVLDSINIKKKHFLYIYDNILHIETYFNNLQSLIYQNLNIF